jgi:hypothetical protein
VGDAAKALRLEKANALLRVIAGCGRRFFEHQGRVGRLELDGRGRLWFRRRLQRGPDLHAASPTAVR